MNLLTIVIALLIGIIHSNTSYCQSAAKQEAGFFARNVLFGGMVSGIGATLNRDEGEKPLKAFFRGAKWGCLGGTALYLGKKASYLVTTQESLGFAWPSKLIHDGGASIILNTANNERPFSKFHTNFGFVRFSVSTGNFKSEVRIMPFSLGDFIYGVVNHKLDLSKTLASGTPLFMADSAFFNGVSTGLSGYNTIYLPRPFSNYHYQIFAHENVHNLQFNEYLTINSFAKKGKRKLDALKIRSVTKFVYFDPPLSLIPQWLFMRQSASCYYKNPFEREAQYFSTHRFVGKCN